MTLDDFKAAVNALRTFQPGNTGWGDTFDAMLDAVEEWGERLWNEKSPIGHVHSEAGGEVAVVFNTAAERSGLAPTAPLLFGETDTGDGWLYYGGDPYDSTKWVQVWRGSGNAVPSIINLVDWQTNPSEYTVQRQNIKNSDGNGADSFYRYVFRKSGSQSTMYIEIGPLPFEGYDLQFVMKYRMATAVSGDVSWLLDYQAVSADDTVGKVANWTAWAAARDAQLTLTDSPSPSADVENLIYGSEIVIPASAYSQWDTLRLALTRHDSDAADTHTGNAEVSSTLIHPASG